MVDTQEVRRLVIIAMFSDDVLMDKLVLKGGNALELVHRLVDRGSKDVDLSIASDFDDIADAKQRIEHALTDRFESAGYVVHDFQFEEMPPVPAEEWWGGYRVEFKIISREKYDQLGSDAQRRRVQSVPVGERGSPTFKIDISKHEFCNGKLEREIDEYTIYVYSLEMIAIEKIRALCQQMEGYDLIPAHAKRPRARDFYDLHAILRSRDINLGAPENLELSRNIFAAKHVPLALIPDIAESREFHRGDWPGVRDSVVGTVEEFDFYFDFVVAEIERLKPLWEE